MSASSNPLSVRARLTRTLTKLLRQAALGKPPSLFDAVHYRRAYPDVAASGIDPFLHYVLRGAARGYDPNEDFDTAFYRRQSGATALDPLRHYIRAGAAAGLDPNPGFSTQMYLTRYADVRQAGINPLLHYRMNGRTEGRIAAPSASQEGEWVALAGVPASLRWAYPGEGTSRFALALLRATPLEACPHRAQRLCLILKLDRLEIDALLHALENFPRGAQDEIALTIDSRARPHPPSPTLILALEQCVYGRSDDGRSATLRYAEARIWDPVPETPTLRASFPAGCLAVRGE